MDQHLINGLFSRAVPAQRFLYDFAAQVVGRSECLRECETAIEKHYAEHADARDAYARLALALSQVPVLPDEDSVLFRQIEIYGRKDAGQGRLTTQGLAWLADGRRRMASLSAAVRMMEARTGLDVRLQWNKLAVALGGCPSPGPVFPILNANLKLAAPLDALILFRELVLDDAYSFPYEGKAPFIIDGGANIGLSLAYFKWRYPDARILAFEPHPVLFDICMDNIRANHWREVEIKMCALAGQTGKASLRFSKAQPMGSTLTDRLLQFEPAECVECITVLTAPLSGFLNGPVDYLKMDIEGVELAVLKEAEDGLSSVHRGFIEYHYDAKSNSNSLASLLALLERNGFVYRVVQPPAEIASGYPIRRLLDTTAWSASIFFKKQ